MNNKHIFEFVIVIVVTFELQSSSAKSITSIVHRFAGIKKEKNESLQLSESRYFSKALPPHETNGIVFLSRFHKLMSPPSVHNFHYEYDDNHNSLSSGVERRNDEFPAYTDAPPKYQSRHPDNGYEASFEYVPHAIKHLKPISTQHHPQHDYWDYGYIPGIPGKPWKDYPLFIETPHTRFTCKHVKYPGYYADTETGCQVWHYCQLDGRHDKFLCPNGTIFNQETRVCDWWYNVRCPFSHHNYDINADLYGVRSNYVQIASNLKSGHYSDSIVQEIPAPPPPPPIAPVIEYVIPPPPDPNAGQLPGPYRSLRNGYTKSGESGNYLPPLNYHTDSKGAVIFAESNRVQRKAKFSKISTKSFNRTRKKQLKHFRSY